jgi:hypothetical protein
MFKQAIKRLRRAASRPRIMGRLRPERVWRDIDPMPNYSVHGLGGKMPDGFPTYNSLRWPSRLGHAGTLVCQYVLSKSFKPGLFADIDLDRLTDFLNYSDTRQTRTIVNEMIQLGALKLGAHAWNMAVDAAHIEGLPRQVKDQRQYCREVSHRARSQESGCTVRAAESEPDFADDDPGGEPALPVEPDPPPAVPSVAPPADPKAAVLEAVSFGLGVLAAYNLLKTNLCEINFTRKAVRSEIDFSEGERGFASIGATIRKQGDSFAAKISLDSGKASKESPALAFDPTEGQLSEWISRQPWGRIDSTRRRGLSDAEAWPVIDRIHAGGKRVEHFVFWLNQVGVTISADEGGRIQNIRGLLIKYVDKMLAFARPYPADRRPLDRSGGPPGEGIE